ncbi:hypothetical protein HHX47_DHR4000216 [Lentinula edodes]|nr:hypothetical protein HHX47_DHR4000216 [Lentinula edodes]
MQVLLKLFRLVNISFTTGTLAVAIQIRNWEKRYGLMGIVGSSPRILEYFGPPLGLRRMSAKLAHMLSKVFPTPSVLTISSLLSFPEPHILLSRGTTTFLDPSTTYLPHNVASEMCCATASWH